MGMSREDIPFVSESFYSSSKIVSFISGKSNDSETAVSNLMVNSWSIFSLKHAAFQSIRPVISRKKRGFSAKRQAVWFETRSVSN